MFILFSGRLIEFCSGLPDFKKTVVGEYLAEIIEACLKTDNNVLPLHALTCLNTCLLRFSNSCIPFKNNIEQCLSNCLEYQGEDVTFIKAAAVAFHYMNQVQVITSSAFKIYVIKLFTDRRCGN